LPPTPEALVSSPTAERLDDLGEARTPIVSTIGEN
jgi:hypothetical protein